LTTVVIHAGAVFAVALLLCATALHAWKGWLELKRLELGQRQGAGGETGLRIELADVRERLKKLEAIADDVEL
jgi:hypothetical protein